jgi:hypothetical protein
MSVNNEASSLMPFTVSGHHVGLSVADLDAEQRWYQLNLGLDEVWPQ